MGYTGKHIQTENERNIVLHPFTIEIGDFVFRIKAKNAFYYDPTISPVRLYKYTFLFNITLDKEYYFFQI